MVRFSKLCKIVGSRVYLRYSMDVSNLIFALENALRLSVRVDVRSC